MSAITRDIWEQNMKSIFRIISGLDAEWRDQTRDFIDPRDQARCLIKVIADQDIGTPEYRITDDVDCGYDIRQLKILTLQAQVESVSMDASERARAHINDIRLRLWRPSILAALRVINTSLIDIGNTTVVDTTRDDRALSVANADIRLHHVRSEPDTPFGRIDKIAVTGTVQDATGTDRATTSLVIDLPDP